MYDASKAIADAGVFLEDLLDPKLQKIEDLYKFCPAY